MIHFFEKIEQIFLALFLKENELLKAKTEALESAKRTEELYAEAIKAYARYSGHYEEDEENDE